MGKLESFLHEVISKPAVVLYCALLWRSDIFLFLFRKNKPLCFVLYNGLKLVSAIFHQIFIFLPNYSPSKTVKNVFYFI